jgi:soluble lytic murein transglycosylase-like protein
MTSPQNRSRSITAWSVTLLCVAAVALGALWWGVNEAKTAGYVGSVVVPAEIGDIVIEAAERCPAVSPEILATQIWAESRWDPLAVSPVGAQGIAQFMPPTWEQYGIDADGDGDADVWNPVDAIHSAAELNCVNRRLVREVPGKRLHNTLAAYNAGFGAVRKYDGVPPFPETEKYLAKILENSKTITFE